MNNNNKDLLFLVPAYNEENRIPKNDYFKNLGKYATVCFVNDGSSDMTKNILTELAQSINGQVIDLPKNVGKAEAIRQGYLTVAKNQKLEFVGFIDADSAFSGIAVENFIFKSLEYLREDSSYKCIISSRIKLSGRNIKRSTFRHYISRILITLIGFTVPNLPYDSQSGLKIFRNSPELRNAMSKPFKTRWFFDIELLIRTNWLASGKVWEEPVLEWRDVAGSHLSLRKAPRLIVEIIRVLRIGRNSRKIS
jgi:glycosyltransferase involved in cell wall biosynthesis